MGPFINLTTGGCNWLSQGGDTCGLATVAMLGVLEMFLGGALGILRGCWPQAATLNGVLISGGGSQSVS